jgi:hypothetical protein
VSPRLAFQTPFGPLVLIAFRHGLRAAELIDLRWDQVDLDNALLHVRRLKNGSPASHPLTGRELRALRRLRPEQPKSPFVFISERGAPFSKRGFQAMLERAGEAAGSDMKIHPHMLRHACGFKLANEGVDTRTITNRSSIRCAIPSCHRRGSKACFGIDGIAPPGKFRLPGRQVRVAGVLRQPGAGLGADKLKSAGTAAWAAGFYLDGDPRHTIVRRVRTKMTTGRVCALL